MRKKSGKTTRRGKRKRLVSPQRTREIRGLVLMAISVLLSLAVITYHASDEVLAQNFSLEAAFNPHDNQAENALGLVGALLASVLVRGFLGYPILLCTVLLFAWGYVAFRNKSPVYLPLVTLATLAGTVLLAAFIGWFSFATESDLHLWSGTVGIGIAGWMQSIFGTIGSFVLLVLMLAITVLLVVDHDIQRSIDRIEDIGARLTNWLSRYQERRQERLEARLEEREHRREERQNRREKRDAERSAQAAQAKHAQSPKPAPTRTAGTAQPRGIDPAPPWFEDTPRPHTPEPEPKGPRDPDNDAWRDDVLDELVDTRRREPREHEPELRVRKALEEMPANLDEREHAIERDTTDIAYTFPSIELLDSDDNKEHDIDYDELEDNKRILLDKLETYNIQITHIDAVVGPTVTLYELTPAPGVKISKITALEHDLAMAMAAPGIRIIAPIPGKSAVGVEIPNRHRELVRIRSILNTARFRDAGMSLPVALGKNIEGEVFVEDLTRMPHLLIAGATGSGKSVGLNGLIAGLLYACRPADLKFVMIDPKKIELAQYANITNHFIAMPEEAEDPIITDFEQAVGTLKSCEKEMEARYDLLSGAMVRNIKDYNVKIRKGSLREEEGHRHLPYIVVIIDELADLMLTAGKDIEGPIARLAQMARAVGIHLILATQRPSVDVITGLIKANFPARVAFQVASKVDSRTILDQNGAEQLVGNGDLLYMVGSRIVRLQGPFISVDEVERITSYIGKQGGSRTYILPPIVDEGSGLGGDTDGGGDKDDLFREAAHIIVRSQQGSVSLLQRKLSVGYTRAARIVDQLEHAGVVGPFEGSKARQVLVQDESKLDELLNPGQG